MPLAAVIAIVYGVKNVPTFDFLHSSCRIPNLFSGLEVYSNSSSNNWTSLLFALSAVGVSALVALFPVSSLLPAAIAALKPVVVFSVSTLLLNIAKALFIDA